ncbi:unnamed protein product [Closterium sp. NIES-54]
MDRDAILASLRALSTSPFLAPGATITPPLLPFGIATPPSPFTPLAPPSSPFAAAFGASPFATSPIACANFANFANLALQQHQHIPDLAFSSAAHALPPLGRSSPHADAFSKSPRPAPPRREIFEAETAIFRDNPAPRKAPSPPQPPRRSPSPPARNPREEMGPPALSSRSGGSDTDWRSGGSDSPAGDRNWRTGGIGRFNGGNDRSAGAAGDFAEVAAAGTVPAGEGRISGVRHSVRRRGDDRSLVRPDAGGQAVQGSGDGDAGDGVRDGNGSGDGGVRMLEWRRGLGQQQQQEHHQQQRQPQLPLLPRLPARNVLQTAGGAGGRGVPGPRRGAIGEGRGGGHMGGRSIGERGMGGHAGRGGKGGVEAGGGA